MTNKIAILVAAPSGSGKTVLATTLAERCMPTVSTDLFLHKILRHPSYEGTALSKVLRSAYPTDAKLNLSAVGRTIEGQPSLVDEFTSFLVDACPLGKPSFCIEGEALMRAAIQRSVKEKLQRHSFVVALATPA